MAVFTDHESNASHDGHAYAVVVRHWHGGGYTLDKVHVVGVGNRKDSDHSYETLEEARIAGDLLARQVIDAEFG
ncbi:hypothetical protein ACVWWJ_001589 [Luteibacter sp. HA06]|jgi:hypothetical protein